MRTMAAVILVLAGLTAFVAMEAVSYAMHRWVMHGFGIGLHQSHHETPEGGFEANDLYPVVFASVAITLFAVGTSLPAPALVAVAAGTTAYGAAYLWVHEIYIHRRLPLARRTYRPLERLRAAHRIHHLYGEEPYGMLLPIVPERLSVRAEGATYDPLVR